MTDQQPRYHDAPIIQSNDEYMADSIDTTKLPDDHSPKGDYVVIEPLSKGATLHLPEKNGIDYTISIKGDVDARISGNHNNMYINGDIRKDSKISLRQGMLSANKVEAGAEIRSSHLLILGEPPPEKLFSDWQAPEVMIVTPPEKRKEVFQRLCCMDGHKTYGVDWTMQHLPEVLTSLQQEGFITAAKLRNYELRGNDNGEFLTLPGYEQVAKVNSISKRSEK